MNQMCGIINTVGSSDCFNLPYYISPSEQSVLSTSMMVNRWTDIFWRDIVDRKVCSKCKIEKPSNEFYGDKRSKDQLRCQCKSCLLMYRNPEYPRIFEGTKICRACGIEKLVEEFYAAKHNKDGLRGQCKNCASKQYKKYIQGLNYPRVLEGTKICLTCGASKSADRFSTDKSRKDGLCNRCKSCVAVYSKKYYQLPKVKAKTLKYGRNRHLLLSYGITFRQKQKMKGVQEGKCMICRENLEDGIYTHVDHNHETGEVRGILCSSCNLMIGLSKDNPDILREAASYIEGRGKCE